MQRRIDRAIKSVGYGRCKQTDSQIGLLIEIKRSSKFACTTFNIGLILAIVVYRRALFAHWRNNLGNIRISENKSTNFLLYPKWKYGKNVFTWVIRVGGFMTPFDYIHPSARIRAIFNFKSLTRKKENEKNGAGFLHFFFINVQKVNWKTKNEQMRQTVWLCWVFEPFLFLI